MRRLGVILVPLIVLTACSWSGTVSNEAETHYILGLSFLREQNPTLALKEFLRAEDLDSGNPDIQAALGQAYQWKKAYTEAERHYLKALKLRRGDPQIQNNLGALYLDMQRWDDAARHFRLAANNLVFSDQKVAWAGLGMALFQKGDILEAVSAYREALEQDPRYVQGRLLLGDAYLALDKVPLAIGEFRQAAEQAPNEAQVHYKLGMAYMRQPDSAKARAAFREVVRLAPTSEVGQKASEYLKILL